VPPVCIREEFFQVNLERLCELAYRAVTLRRLGPREFAVIAIDVDEPAWTEFAELLMPGHDWQQYRDRGESPVARGSIPWLTVEGLCHMVPDIKSILTSDPPAGQAYALICAAGGCSVYAVPYIPAHVAGGEG
jgi:rhodanese-related sulfurtransferase